MAANQTPAHGHHSKGNPNKPKPIQILHTTYELLKTDCQTWPHVSAYVYIYETLTTGFRNRVHYYKVPDSFSHKVLAIIIKYMNYNSYYYL